MIEPRLLRRVLRTIVLLRTLELDRDAWTQVLALVPVLGRAVRMGDEAQLREVVAALERLGAHRAGPLIEGKAVAPPPVGPPPEADAVLAEADAALAGVTTEIRRTPHIDLDAEPPLEPGAEFAVEVYADTRPSNPDEQADAVVVEPPEGLREVEVDVWLCVSPHFEVVGAATGRIVLHADSERSTSAPFELRVVDDVPLEAGPPRLMASFGFRGRWRGRVVRLVPLRAGDALLGDEHTEDVAPGELRIRDTPGAPDIEVAVNQVEADRFEVQISSTVDGGVVLHESWRLEGGAQEFVKRTMATFIDKKATPLSRQVSLKSAGMVFFDAAPSRFQELYWRLVDAGTPPRTLSIVSDERAVPWELMIPSRGTGRAYEEGDPLGVQCAVARWHQPNRYTAEPRIPLRDSVVVAPEYRKKLPTAVAERDFVLAQYAGAIAPDTFDALDAFFREHDASLLHFICHGRDDALQSIVLADNQKLLAHQLRGSGLATACRARRPLVFLNACEIGRPAIALYGVGGFAMSFISIEAGAVIAPLWAVNDTVAHEVATAFYTAIQADPARPFADVLRDVRARAYEEGGADSFAAYCFYGDPTASTLGDRDE